MGLYERAVRDSVAVGEHKDCAIKAVSIATGNPYQYILGAFRAFGRKLGQVTPFHSTGRVIQCLDYHLVEVPLSTVTGRTVRTIPKQLPRGIFLLRTSKHILCVKNGKAHDWTAGRGHRVTDIYRVERWYCDICKSTERVEEKVLPPTEFCTLPTYVRKYFHEQFSTRMSYRIRDLYPEKLFRHTKLCACCQKNEYEALRA